MFTAQCVCEHSCSASTEINKWKGTPLCTLALHWCRLSSLAVSPVLQNYSVSYGPLGVKDEAVEYITIEILKRQEPSRCGAGAPLFRGQQYLAPPWVGSQAANSKDSQLIPSACAPASPSLLRQGGRRRRRHRGGPGLPMTP